jgi:hypothetical protein
MRRYWPGSSPLSVSREYRFWLPHDRDHAWLTVRLNRRALVAVLQAAIVAQPGVWPSGWTDELQTAKAGVGSGAL